MRLDKYLCDCKVGSRSKVKNLIKQGQVYVNGIMSDRPELHIQELKDKITVGKTILQYHTFDYFMLHKPAGYVCAASDKYDQTVSDLMEETGYPDLFSIGRLDKDTEGLLIMTNDGELAHRLLSPKKHVEKVYLVQMEQPLGTKEIEALEEGVDIGEKRSTLPAKVEQLEEKTILLTITEGKFHQVKRMLQAVGNQVNYLKRLRLGPISLDPNLPVGGIRRLTEEEEALLKKQE